MNDSRADTKSGEVDLAISLTEAALAQCDRAGLIFAGIDISSALDKLRAAKGNMSSSKD
jgi:hypothetical protein